MRDRIHRNFIAASANVLFCSVVYCNVVTFQLLRRFLLSYNFEKLYLLNGETHKVHYNDMKTDKFNANSSGVCYVNIGQELTNFTAERLLGPDFARNSG